MWEILTQDRPFPGLSQGQIIAQVCVKGKRPPVPDAPGMSDIVELMERCWAPEPSERPAFAELAEQLKVTGQKDVTESLKPVFTTTMTMDLTSMDSGSAAEAKPIAATTSLAVAKVEQDTQKAEAHVPAPVPLVANAAAAPAQTDDFERSWNHQCALLLTLRAAPSVSRRSGQRTQARAQGLI